MKGRAFNTTVLFYPNSDPRRRLFALWTFTSLMILWNLLGHTVIGFEQSWATPVAAVTTAILVQMFLDVVDARANNREVRFAGGVVPFLNFLPAALIPGFACGMLLYPNERLMPVVFASALSIASKVLFRAPVGGGRYQHVFNPSNLGIAMTLLLIPEVGVAPPYQFAGNLSGAQLWVVPCLILATGIVVHALFTGRLPLVLAWLAGFILQGVVRAMMFGTPLLVPLMPMTSVAFVVFTLYMIPDPATTPVKPVRQVAFGFAVALAYGLILMAHLVFGLFFALLSVCAIRGLSLYAWNALGKLSPQPRRVEA